MTYQPSVTESDIFTALRSFLLTLNPSGCEVVRGFDNLVPTPLSDFIAMSPIGIPRISTNEESYNFDPLDIPNANISIRTGLKYTIQLDFVGSLSGSRSQAFTEIIRSETACSLFPNTVTPLECTDPRYIQMVTGEQQYIDRWQTDIDLQYNPVITVLQQYAGDSQVTMINVI